MAETSGRNTTVPGNSVLVEKADTTELVLTDLRGLAGVSILGAVTLATDILMSDALWIAFLHISLMVLGIWLVRSRDVLLLAALAGGLVVLGHLLSGPVVTNDPEWAHDLAHRLIVLLAIAALAAVLFTVKRHEAVLGTQLAEANARLGALERVRRANGGRAADLALRIADTDDLGHEVRTQLNAIIGFSEAGRRELFGAHSDPRYREYLGHINDSGHRLLRVFETRIDWATRDADETGKRRRQGRSGARPD